MKKLVLVGLLAGCNQSQLNAVKSAVDIAHELCTIAGLTDGECVKRVLAERQAAMTRAAMLAPDAGAE